MAFEDTLIKNEIFMVRIYPYLAKYKKICIYISLITQKHLIGIWYEELCEILEKLNWHGKDIELICNLYLEERNCMWTEDKFNECTKAERRVWQGFFFPMNLCNLYSEMSLRALEDWPEFIIHAYNFNNIIQMTLY